jgi:intermembrane space import and assembly protein 40
VTSRASPPANSENTVSRKQSPQSTDASPAPTLDSVKPRIRDERAQSQPAGQHADAQQPQPQTEPQPSDPGAVNPADLEEEAGQEAAFNPETGEINWDCPCLGGMAHGPCGEEFKAAFSCFVYSQEEPKGMDCIDKFKCVCSPAFHLLEWNILVMCC